MSGVPPAPAGTRPSFPAIDALRALAALLVLVYHVIEIGRWTEFPSVDDAVISRFGLIEHREAVGMIHPGKFSGIDDDATDGCAMAAHVFGQRVHDDICPKFNRFHQCGRGYGIVDDDGNAVPVRHTANGFHVGDVACGIAQ